MNQIVEKALSVVEIDACTRLYNLLRSFVSRTSHKKLPTASCARALLDFFLDSDNARRTRRWSAVLLEAFISQIPTLRQDVLRLTDLLPSLGQLTIRGDEELKLSSSTLVRALAKDETQSGIQWVQQLNAFMNDVMSPNAQIYSPVNLLANFIQDVEVQAVKRDEATMFRGSNYTIYLSLQNSVTIMAVPISREDPLFVDIPFDRISEANIRQQELTASQDNAPVPQLVLDLRPNVWNYLLYALQGIAKTIILTFSNMTQAERVAEIIKERRAELKEPKMSMSQSLDISQDRDRADTVGSEAVPEAASEDELTRATADVQTDAASLEAAFEEFPNANTAKTVAAEGRMPQEEVSRTKEAAVGVQNSRKRLLTAPASQTSKGSKAPQAKQITATPNPKTGRLFAGKLATLSAALSPEPDEPVNAVFLKRDVDLKSWAQMTAQTRGRKRMTAASKARLTPIVKQGKPTPRKAYTFTTKTKGKIKTAKRLSDLVTKKPTREANPTVSDNTRICEAASKMQHLNNNEITLLDDASPLPEPNVAPNLPTPDLADSQSARKSTIISFDRSGPRTQGHKAISIGRVSAARSDPIHGNEITEGEPEQLLSMVRNGFRTRPTLQFASYAQAQQIPNTWSNKRPLHTEFSDRRPKMRQKMQHTLEQNDDDFVPIDINPDTAGKTSRKVMQRSSHINDDGSPIPNEVPDELPETADMPILPNEAAKDPYSDLIPAHQDKIAHQNLPGNGSQRANFDADRPLSGSESIRPQRGSGIMSSYCKPVPQPSNSELQAVSGYAPERVVREAVARNQEEEMANDPFNSVHTDVNEKSRFMRRLSKLVIDRRQDLNTDPKDPEDPNKTAVEDTQMQEANSISSLDDENSSASEEPEEEPDDVEEMEWEAALLPRHRNMLQVLGRISRRLVSHLADSEVAVQAIVEEYTRDGNFVIDKTEETYNEQRGVTGPSSTSTSKLLKQYGDSERKLLENTTSLSNVAQLEILYWESYRDEKLQLLDQLELRGSP